MFCMCMSTMLTSQWLCMDGAHPGMLIPGPLLCAFFSAWITSYKEIYSMYLITIWVLCTKKCTKRESFVQNLESLFLNLVVFPSEVYMVRVEQQINLLKGFVRWYTEPSKHAKEIKQLRGIIPFMREHSLRNV